MLILPYAPNISGQIWCLVLFQLVSNVLWDHYTLTWHIRKYQTLLIFLSAFFASHHHYEFLSSKISFFIFFRISTKENNATNNLYQTLCFNLRYIRLLCSIMPMFLKNKYLLHIVNLKPLISSFGSVVSPFGVP